MGQIHAPQGANTKKTIVGRGKSSHGRFSGKGMNGQNARSGGGVRPGFEGGQMPLYRRLPKRGFKNIWAKTYAEVNVSSLNRFNDGETVNAVTLIEAGVIKNVEDGVKLLGNGDLTKKLNITVKLATKSAIEKVQQAGGEITVIGR